MLKKYTLPNCDNNRIYIDHKRRRVIMSSPVKNKAFKILFYNFLGWWFIILFIFLFTNFIMLYQILPDEEKEQNSNFLESFVKFLSIIEITILMVFIPPIIISLMMLKNPKYLEIFPEWQKNEVVFLNRGYYYIKKKRLNSKIFEIPIFENVFLDYKLKGDFKKYIKNVSIREYDFKHKKVSFGKKTTQQQTFYWKAIFEFEEIPIRGEMIVKFL